METVGVSKVYHVGKEMVSPVSDVSLQVAYGDFAVIFGPSGAGKTTLLNCLMGLEEPDVGEVFLKGSDLYRFSEEDRTTIRKRKISFVPQAQYWIEYMSVLDNVALPLFLSGVHMKEARTRAREVLLSFGLHDRIKHKPSELSSGQQQKVSLARALVKKPWIIFADEPTAHLDTQSVKEVAKILLEVNKTQGVTIIMVTHDLSFLKLSKKWFFMKDGRLHDIRDRDNPFKDIEEAVSYLEEQPNGAAK